MGAEALIKLPTASAAPTQRDRSDRSLGTRMPPKKEKVKPLRKAAQQLLADVKAVHVNDWTKEREEADGFIDDVAEVLRFSPDYANGERLESAHRLLKESDKVEELLDDCALLVGAQAAVLASYLPETHPLRNEQATLLKRLVQWRGPGKVRACKADLKAKEEALVMAKKAKDAAAQSAMSLDSDDDDDDALVTAWRTCKAEKEAAEKALDAAESEVEEQGVDLGAGLGIELSEALLAPHHRKRTAAAASSGGSGGGGAAAADGEEGGGGGGGGAEEGWKQRALLRRLAKAAGHAAPAPAPAPAPDAAAAATAEAEALKRKQEAEERKKAAAEERKKAAAQAEARKAAEQGLKEAAAALLGGVDLAAHSNDLGDAIDGVADKAKIRALLRTLRAAAKELHTIHEVSPEELSVLAAPLPELPSKYAWEKLVAA